MVETQGPLPCYRTVRPEVRLYRVSRQLYQALEHLFELLGERVLQRFILSHRLTSLARDPTSYEAEKLARFEQALSQIYYDDRCTTRHNLPRNLGLSILNLLACEQDLPEYKVATVPNWMYDVPENQCAVSVDSCTTRYTNSTTDRSAPSNQLFHTASVRKRISMPRIEFVTISTEATASTPLQQPADSTYQRKLQLRSVINARML